MQAPNHSPQIQDVMRRIKAYNLTIETVKKAYQIDEDYQNFLNDEVEKIRQAQEVETQRLIDLKIAEIAEEKAQAEAEEKAKAEAEALAQTNIERQEELTAQSQMTDEEKAKAEAEALTKEELKTQILAMNPITKIESDATKAELKALFIKFKLQA